MKTAAAFALALVAATAKPEELVATINKGKTCKLAVHDKNQLNCTYVIGGELVIEIAGIGDRMASIAIPRSIEKPDSKYTATIGLADGCVRVKRWGPTFQEFAIAFISPKDGKVYGAAGPWCSWFAEVRNP